MADEKKDAPTDNPEEKKAEENTPNVSGEDSKAHFVSPDVKLTALFTCKFQRDWEEAHMFALDWFTRLFKMFGLTFNLVGLLLLMFFFTSFYRWAQIDLAMDSYMWFNLYFACFIFALDITGAVFTLVRWLIRAGEYKNGHVVREEQFFLKSMVVIDTFSSINGTEVMREIVFPYADVKKVTETEGHFIYALKDGREYRSYKPGFVLKKMELDTMRGKIENSTGKTFYIGSYKENSRYELFFAHALIDSRCIDTIIFLTVLSFFLLFPGMLLNFRTGMPMDFVWLWWLAAIIDAGFLISILVIKSNQREKISKNLFHIPVWILAFFLTASMVIGISASLYNTLSKFGKKAAIFSAESEISLPTTSQLDQDNTTSLSETQRINNKFVTLFREETAAVLTKDSEVEALNSSLTATGSKWLATADINSTYARVFPSEDHRSSVGDYYLCFSNSLKQFWPTYAQVGDDDEDMWCVCYDKDGSELFLIHYNIIGGFVYNGN